MLEKQKSIIFFFPNHSLQILLIGHAKWKISLYHLVTRIAHLKTLKKNWYFCDFSNQDLKTQLIQFPNTNIKEMNCNDDMVICVLEDGSAYVKYINIEENDFPFPYVGGVNNHGFTKIDISGVNSVTLSNHSVIFEKNLLKANSVTKYRIRRLANFILREKMNLDNWA